MTTPDDCPECGAEMEQKSASGTGRHGRPAGVSWAECPECDTWADDFGNVHTPADRERALEIAHELAQPQDGGDADGE